MRFLLWHFVENILSDLSENLRLSSLMCWESLTWLVAFDAARICGRTIDQGGVMIFDVRRPPHILVVLALDRLGRPPHWEMYRASYDTWRGWLKCCRGVVSSVNAFDTSACQRMRMQSHCCGKCCQKWTFRTFVAFQNMFVLKIWMGCHHDSCLEGCYFFRIAAVGFGDLVPILHPLTTGKTQSWQLTIVWLRPNHEVL